MAARADMGTRAIQLARDQQKNQEKDGVENAGQRRAATRPDVGGSSGDCAGRGQAAKQRGGDVGNTLGHELLSGTMTKARHAVGHHGGQQRLDAGQEGDGECRRQ